MQHFTHNSHSRRRRQTICHRNLLCVDSCRGHHFLRNQLLHEPQRPLGSRFPVLFVCTGVFHDPKYLRDIYNVLGRDCFAFHRFLLRLCVTGTVVPNNFREISRLFECNKTSNNVVVVVVAVVFVVIIIIIVIVVLCCSRTTLRRGSQPPETVYVESMTIIMQASSSRYATSPMHAAAAPTNDVFQPPRTVTLRPMHSICFLQYHITFTCPQACVVAMLVTSASKGDLPALGVE